MDEISTKDAIERGRHARRLLGDDVLQEAFTDARADTIAEWIGADSIQMREELHARMLQADVIESVLQGYVADVEVFEAQQPVDEE